VLVFDDVSELISAQRAVAWAEVARRLAHEIKNPLTPIQLAAERMQMKLHDKLGAADAEMLGKNTRTIVNQVSALKYMVDEFRDYARLPSARLDPLDLNALIDEILRLYGDGKIVSHLESFLPLVMGDATLLRQVVHNLVKNALEATEKVVLAQVHVTTQSVKLVDGQTAVRLSIRDNGGGFADALLARAFEPYVTSKPRGSGLGLPIVKKIIEEHGARIDISNVDPNPQDSQKQEIFVEKGALVTVLFTKLGKNEHNTSVK
jgi:nitrogen fixation/metabolism regulation signal transduction histidine kinase